MTSPEKLSEPFADAFEERVRLSLEQNLGKIDFHEGGFKAPSQTSLLVALSGGPDSTALLLACQKACQQLSIRLSVCHVNHALRATESDEDEQFCRALCQKLDIAISCRRLSLQNERVSEQTLREARHLILEEEAEIQNASAILFGHTADDQIETIVFRFFRGTALKGLIGIKAVRPTKSGRYFIRPLLAFSKEDCLRYLEKKGVVARQDSSNLDERFTRNFLRHKILPLVNERFKGFALHVENMRSIIKEEEEFFESILADKLDEILIDPEDTDRWDRAKFNLAPTAIKRRLIALALEERGQSISFERIENIILTSEQSGTSTTTLDQNWRVHFEPNEVIWHPSTTNDDATNRPLDEIAVRIPGLNMVLARDRALKVEVVEGAVKGQVIAFPRASELEALVDLSQIKSPLVIRSRRAGDLITPFGMKETMRLKRYLQTHKPNDLAEVRAHLAVVADGEEIIWVPGVGLSEKVRVKGTPTHRLSWLKLSSQDPALV